TGPASATVGACTGPGEGPWGHIVPLNISGSCCEGARVENKDFTNGLVQDETNCPEDSPRSSLLTRTVDTSKPVGGAGVAGSPVNYWTLKDAYNAAKVSPSSKDEVIGMFSKTVENVVLDNYTAKSMTITQCTSATLTAKYSNQPVWDITANK